MLSKCHALFVENCSWCTQSAPSSSHNDKGNDGKEDLSECGSNVLAEKDENDQALGEFSDIFSDSSDTNEDSSEERFVLQSFAIEFYLIVIYEYPHLGAYIS